MFEKVQLNKEWKLSPKEIKPYYGVCSDSGFIVKIKDENSICDVHITDENLTFFTNPEFYGFANRSMLVSAHIIPNELLQFQVCSYMDPSNTIETTIRKINPNEYSVEVYSKEIKRRGYYSPEKDVKETLNKEELLERLKHIPEILQPYPFLGLPLGNCFECES